MQYEIRTEGEFKYIDEGRGEVLLLLHGLFGALSNWEGVIEGFKHDYRVVIPLLPIYEMPRNEASVEGLCIFTEEFVKLKQLSDLTILGNSLGGHVGLVYALRNPEKVKRMVLTGSSGLFENSMGGSFPRRGSYPYIKERVEYTFYSPETATKELVDEVFSITNDISKCMRIVSIAKSAQRHNMAKDVSQIQAPTLLVWGLNDTITPAMVGHDFNRLMTNSELYFIDRCCHAPMMEHPQKFNNILKKFLGRHKIVNKVTL